MPRPPRFTGAPILLRLTPEARAELDRLAWDSGVPLTDVARLALELGLPAARAQLPTDRQTDTDPGEGS